MKQDNEKLNVMAVSTACWTLIFSKAEVSTYATAPHCFLTCSICFGDIALSFCLKSAFVPTNIIIASDACCSISGIHFVCKFSKDDESIILKHNNITLVSRYAKNLNLSYSCSPAESHISISIVFV